MRLSLTTTMCGLWVWTVYQLGQHTWSSGPASWVRLYVLLALLIAAYRSGSRFPVVVRTRALAIASVVVCVAAWAGFGSGAITQWQGYTTFTAGPGTQVSLIDIGANTLCAGRRFFSNFENPYSHRCQSHEVSGPNIVHTADQRTMFGVRYPFGYPYFPVMFASYEPFRRLHDDDRAIRVGNYVFLWLTALGACALSGRWVTGRDRSVAVALTAATFLMTGAPLSRNLFAEGVTDLTIGVYIIYSLLAASFGLPILAGILCGLMLGSKLLPPAFLVVLMVAYYLRRPERYRFLVPLAATLAMVFVPFFVADFPAFVSSTVLYYLTNHAMGDDTSLWFYLGDVVQPAFLAGGALAVGISLVASVRWATKDLYTLSLGFMASFILFLSFNKMMHYNYLVAVIPLGASLMATAVLRSGTARDELLSSALIEGHAPAFSDTREAGQKAR